VVLVLRVLPARLLGAVLFAGLADDQVGTNARNAIAVVFPTINPVLLVPLLVVDVLDGVVEADEVVLVLETEHKTRVVVVTVFLINSEAVVEGGAHRAFVDEPVTTIVARGLRPVAALVDPVASFALTSVAVVTSAVLAVIEATLLEIAELGFVTDCFFPQLGQVRAKCVLEVLELDLRVRDKDTTRASRKPPVRGLHFVDKHVAVRPNHNLTIGPGQHRDFVERVLLVLPGMRCHAVLFAVLADDQVGTNGA